MRNNIAYFEKTSSSKVIFWAKFNAEINLLIQLVFSKEAILFLIYLLADKAKYGFYQIINYFLQNKKFMLPSNY